MAETEAEDIDLFPLTGYATATLPESGVLLEIGFLTGPLDTSGQSRRFGMTAAQARELGQALVRAADAAAARTDRGPGARH